MFELGDELQEEIIEERGELGGPKDKMLTGFIGAPRKSLAADIPFMWTAQAVGIKTVNTSLLSVDTFIDKMVAKRSKEYDYEYIEKARVRQERKKAKRLARLR